MQRRIQETNGNWVTFQSLIQLLEVSLLYRKNLLQSSLSLLNGIRTDHLTERVDSITLEEHMLGTAKADSLCAQLTSFLSVSRSVCIGTNFQSSVFVCPSHNSFELTSDGSVNRINDTVIDFTGGTVDGQPVSLVEFFSSQSKFLVCLIHSDLRATRYTAGTHTTGNYGCMGSHTTAYSQNTLGSFHTFDVFWRGLKTNQNNLLASCSPLFCILCCEDNLTTCSSW